MLLKKTEKIDFFIRKYNYFNILIKYINYLWYNLRKIIKIN